MKIIVAGGGIGGLAVAVVLGRLGIDCVLHERRSSADGAGSGLVLHPNGLGALRQIDEQLYADVCAAGHSPPAGVPTYVLAHGGRVIAQKVPQPRARPVAIRRAELLRLLETYATKARIVRGSEIVGYDGWGVEVRVHVRGTARDTEVVTGTALIGADGLRSRIRGQMLDDGSPRPIGLTSVKCIAEAGSRDPRLRGGFVLFDHHYQAFCAPIGPDSVYWDITVAAEPGAWPRRDPERVRRDLLAPRWDWPPFVLDMIAAADPSALVVTELQARKPLKRWSSGAVALLGDAAHPTTPFLGQGSNQALLDAVAVADALAGTPGDVPAALHGYAHARAAVANRAMRDSQRIGRRGQSTNALVRALRDHSVRVDARRSAP
jgi:salicylate hydroxylase